MCTNCEFRPPHSSVARHAADTAARTSDAMNAVWRSRGLWTAITPDPNRLSTGVRNQNKKSAATVNNSSGQTTCTEAMPAATPVNKGMNSSPQAPCSRGTIRARVRAGRTASSLLTIAVNHLGHPLQHMALFSTRQPDPANDRPNWQPFRRECSAYNFSLVIGFLILEVETSGGNLGRISFFL